MARIITKELADKIAKKLKAAFFSSGAHDIACVFHNDKIIASFGIRRGSEKDKGHDHIPRDLHIGPNKARLLGQCPMSRDEWISIMRAKGLIDDENTQADQ